MNRLHLALVLTALGTLLGGCAPPVVSNYASLSTHTLQVAPDKQADVVWLQRYADGEFILMRCHNGAEGPVCTKVKSP